MEILCGLSAVACVALTLVSILLYLDGKGARKARAAWESGVEMRLDDHNARLVGYSARLATVERCTGLAAPAPALARSTAQSSAPPVSVASPPSGGLPVRLVSVTRDDDPAHTRETVVEGAADLGPATPQATKEGDDGRRTSSRPPPLVTVLGAPPAAAAPESETREQIRARLEAAENEREQARARGEAPPLHKLADDDDEATMVKDAGAVRAALTAATSPPTRHPTLLGGFGGAAPEPPPRSRTPSSPTLVSAQPSRPPILPPPNAGDMESETERRYEELRAKVRAMGLKVDHCHAETEGCSKGDDDQVTPAGFTSGQWRSMAAPDVCHCNCEGCRRAMACLLQAQREVARARRRT